MAVRKIRTAKIKMDTKVWLTNVMCLTGLMPLPVMNHFCADESPRQRLLVGPKGNLNYFHRIN